VSRLLGRKISSVTRPSNWISSVYATSVLVLVGSGLLGRKTTSVEGPFDWMSSGSCIISAPAAVKLASGLLGRKASSVEGPFGVISALVVVGLVSGLLGRKVREPLAPPGFARSGLLGENTRVPSGFIVKRNGELGRVERQSDSVALQI
jgi:hypothetical protein